MSTGAKHAYSLSRRSLAQIRLVSQQVWPHDGSPHWLKGTQVADCACTAGGAEIEITAAASHAGGSTAGRYREAP